MVESRITSRKICRKRRRVIRLETGRAGERIRQARRGSANDGASGGKDGYDLPLAALSVGPLEEVGPLILRSGEPEIGEGDGDLS